jgi:putative ABC transport system substrate-binding protein
MKRRDVLGLLSSGAVVWPFAAWAEQAPAPARIGWIAHGDAMPRHFFEETMARFGWVEGKNLIVERRFTGSAGETLAADAAALVGWKPDVIVAMGAVDAIAILASSRSIPIVVVTANDPVRQGLAVSLSHPGGNVTGTASVTGKLLPKLVELLHEFLPGSRRVSVLGDPSNPGTLSCAKESASNSG